MIDTMLFAIGLTGLIIGSFTDLKKREVPDWLNYFLIAAGLGLRLINSLISSDWLYFLYGAAGFGVFLALAYLMYYAGQWGGGDSKLLMGIGAIFATYPLFLLNYFNPLLNLPFLAVFLINTLLVGALYGLIYSLVLAFKFKKKFLGEFNKVLLNKKYTFARNLILIISAIFLFFSFLFFKNLFLVFLTLILVAILVFTFYIWVFIKAVEKACMFKYIVPEKLVEGDWIAKNIVVNGKIICSSKGLGIEKKQINKLIKLKKQNKINKILIKEGVPFVPSFLIGMLISLVWGNWVFWFL